MSAPKITIAVSMAASTVKNAIAPPIVLPKYFVFPSPMYRLMSTVTPVVRLVITKVTRLIKLLPVDTADIPADEPKRPTTRRSTAPYIACKINAPRTGNINLSSLESKFPLVKSLDCVI